ncbi:MAG TPA: RsiV family protein [Paludibacter sp.]|nr:RsiV family protein [Paludibacter sp.]
MRKQSILFVLSILIAPVFFSCTHKTIKTEELDVAKRCFLTKDTSQGSLSIDIQVEIPTAFVNKSILDSIRSTIISNLFGQNYVKYPNDSLIQHFVKDICADYTENNKPLVNLLDSGSMYSFNNEHTLSGFSLLSDKNIYVYGIERYVYMGGAHGLETRNYFNFNLKTGALITEKDLFKDGYMAALSELIKQRIVEESKDSAEKEPILDLEDTDYWTDSIKPNGNFYITDEGINYVFNPYQIAPYSLGETEVTLPFDRLKNILKVNNPINYLIEKQAAK